MQSQELLEVAGLVAAHARSLVCEQPELSEQSIVDYWLASRCRFDSWGYDLRAYSVAASKTPVRPMTERLYRLSVEIEASDVLARTIAALGMAHDTVHNRHETAPVTANVLAGHRDVVVRLNAILASRDEDAFRDVARFRSLRSRLHQLNDELIACFLPLAPVTPFAHNPRDVARLGEVAGSRIARGGEAADWTTLSGTISNLRHDCGDVGPNADQNHKVAAAAMGLFTPDMFDSYGLLRTTWLRRLERTEGETSVLIEDWLATETSSTPSTASRLSRSE